MNNFEKYWSSVKDNYFDYNGVRYYAGTRFKIKAQYDWDVREGFFVSWCNHDQNICLIRTVYPWPGRTADIWVPRDEMQERIVEITEGNHYVETSAKVKYVKDSDIPELFFGWIIYIAIMIVLLIFKGRWIGWIIATCYFFYWRNNIKKENIYIDGE